MERFLCSEAVKKRQIRNGNTSKFMMSFFHLLPRSTKKIMSVVSYKDFHLVDTDRNRPLFTDTKTKSW